VKSNALFLFASLLLLLNGMVHAEGECPPGMFSTNPPGTQGPISCAPIPSYAQNPGQQAPPQTPQPPPERWQDHWGAIATDAPSGSLGASINMASADSAEQAALEDCHSKHGASCKIQTSYRNQCAAMILGDKVFNVHVGLTVAEATNAGMKACTPASSNCHVYYTACSLPQRIQ